MADHKRYWTRRKVLVASVLVTVLGVVGRIATWRNPGVTVSPKTTFITAPLRADGTVDYLAAVNERSSQGVTPQNNAAVLLVEAVGPEAIHESARDRFFQMLGIDPPPEGGPHLERFADYLERTMPLASPPNEDEDSDYRRQEVYGIRHRLWTMADSPSARRG